VITTDQPAGPAKKERAMNERRLWPSVLAVALMAAAALWVAWPAEAQWAEITTNAVKPADTAKAITIGPSATSGVQVTTAGKLNQLVADTDGWAFIPAYQGCIANTITVSGVQGAKTLVASRQGLNQWSLHWSSGPSLAPFKIVCSLNSWLQRLGVQKGYALKTVSIVHQFSAAPGSTFTEWGRLASCTYANNTAITCGENLVASPTMPSASDPEPQVTTATLTTAAYIASQVDLNLEFGVEIPQGGNGIYNLYGVFVTFNRLDH